MFLLCLVCVGLAYGTGVPEQVHLSFGSTNDEGFTTGYVVGWFTQDSRESFVQFGLSPDKLDQLGVGSSSNYAANYGYHHAAPMDKLAPSTQYYYRVGDPKQEMSQVFSFKSPPQNTSDSFSVSIFGDMGWLDSDHRPMIISVFGLQKKWSATLTRNIMEQLKDAGKIDFVWHLGDVGYADDSFAHSPVHFTYEDAYNGFMNWMQNISSAMPYMVAAGNHESECHSPACFVEHSLGKSISNFTAYNKRWHMPSASSNGVLNMWYSFNRGPVHFVTINTETDWPGAGEEKKGDSGLWSAGGFGRPGEYIQWLEADLAAANATRDKRPFIIVGGHRPFAEIGAQAQALLDKYQVDVYFAGHAHKYIRTLPTSMENGIDHESVESINHYRNPKGTTYIVAGGAGCDEMSFLADPEHPGVFSMVREDPDAEQWDARTPHLFGPHQSAVQELEFLQMASGVLNVINRTTLHYQLLESFNGTVLDELYITRE